MTLAEILHNAKTVRLRVRNTYTLQDYLCLSRLNNSWLHAIDLQSGYAAHLMLLVSEYARLSSEEEIENLGLIPLEDLAKVLMASKSDLIQQITALSIDEGVQ
jgi:hypothetical protein